MSILRKYLGPGGHVVIPEGITEIGDEAFSGNHSIETIELPNSLVKIGRWAFQFCSVKEVIMPDSVKMLGHSCFFECFQLVKIRLSRSLKAIPAYCFQQCHQLKEIEIPEGVQILEENAFCVCENLETVALPESLLEIGYCAFAGCTALKNISIPSGVTKIGNRAFQKCELLTEEQTTPRRVSFYTVQSEKGPTGMTVNGVHIARAGYDAKDVERILKEAEEYEIHCKESTERCGWYTDDKTESSHSNTVRVIRQDTILVKDGHFYGCVMEYNHSYWSYHTTDDRTEFVLLTVDDKKDVLISFTDHSTDNGDYSSSTYARLVRTDMPDD